MTSQELELTQFAQMFSDPGFALLFAVLTIWSLAWKGIALWKAAKNNSTAWYVVMLILNTVGILEIIYIFFFSKKKNIPQQ